LKEIIFSLAYFYKFIDIECKGSEKLLITFAISLCVKIKFYFFWIASSLYRRQQKHSRNRAQPAQKIPKIGYCGVYLITLPLQKKQYLTFN
jgi:hypothetical protein